MRKTGRGAGHSAPPSIMSATTPKLSALDAILSKAGSSQKPTAGKSGDAAAPAGMEPCPECHGTGFVPMEAEDAADGGADEATELS